LSLSNASRSSAKNRVSDQSRGSAQVRTQIPVSIEHPSWVSEESIAWSLPVTRFSFRLLTSKLKCPLESV
jgi:hypothetical protein